MDATDENASAGDTRSPAPHSAGFVEVFLLFSRLGLSSFGGGLPAWMHRACVEQRGWLGEMEFSAALALARILPGVNVVNLAVLIGQRLRGFSGAAAAVMGLLVGPCLGVVVLAMIYGQFAGTMILDAALDGATASAVGLLIGMGFGSGGRIIRKDVISAGRLRQGIGSIVVLVAMFALVGVLRLPTVPTVLCLGPLSIALALFALRRASTEQHDDAG